MHWTNEHYVFLQGAYKGPLVRLTQTEFIHAVWATTEARCQHCHPGKAVAVPVKHGDKRFGRAVR